MPLEPAPEPTSFAFLQSFFGPKEYLSQDEDGNFTAVPRITMGPPSIYDVKCGLDYAPGCAAALARWHEKITPRSVVAGVATWAWPTPASMEESAIQLFTADLGTAAVSIAIPRITDAAFLELEPRAHTLYPRVLNNSLPSLPANFAAAAPGNIPVRFLPGIVAPPVPHGQILEYEVQTSGNDIAYVRAARVLGDTVPPTTLLVDSARGTSAASVTQLSSASFNPFMAETEAMLLFIGRITGTAAVRPADRGWEYPTDPDLDGVGGVLNGTSSALRVAVSISRPGGAGLVDGTGTMSSQQFLHASAWRGCGPTDFKKALSTGTTVAFPSYETIAPGGFVIYAVQVNSTTAVAPEGGVSIDNLPVAQSGWSWRVVSVEPDANGNVAPPNVTLATAAVCQIIAVRMEPN